MQQEVFRSLVQQRFALDVTLSDQRIFYKETIENTVEGVGHFEPLRHYAEVHLLLEPLPAGQRPGVRHRMSHGRAGSSTGSGSS